MATPLIETIAAALETAINAITTGNGFNETLTAKRSFRETWRADRPDDKLVHIVQGDPAEGESPVGGQTWIQPFEFNAVLLDSDDATDSIDIRINQVGSDIAKKLRENHALGGAQDIRIQSIEKFPEDIGFSGVTVTAEIEYRHKQDDPYTAI